LENRDIPDSVAEGSEFELPVPISEQPDDNIMLGPWRPDEVSGSPEAQTPGLHDRQNSNKTCAMNDIATDVAAAL
jgi:hypothetical protein